MHIPSVIRHPSSVNAHQPPTPSPQPPFVRLEIVPKQIVLDGPQARQQVLVNGIRRDGSALDLTDAARFEAANTRKVRLSPDGVAYPIADGQTTITARVGGLSTKVIAEVKNSRKPFAWSFENHVEPVLTKQGCNQGICHGAASGKGGFRLSLRAYDPEMDYARLRYEGRGRRLSLAAPSESLLLKKPSLALAHFGGEKLKCGTREYRVVSDWIKAGAPGPQPSTPKLIRLEVYPRERVVQAEVSTDDGRRMTDDANPILAHRLPVSSTQSPIYTSKRFTSAYPSVIRHPSSVIRQHLLVTAHFSDGHTEDVTHWAKYSSNEENVASVDEAGRVTVRRPGEAAIAVGYLGQVAFARLALPFPNRIAASRYQTLPRSNVIDDRIYTKLAQLHLWPSELCTDGEFVRRAYLDTIGLLPSPEETRAFLADPDPQKRANLIDALLARTEYVDNWTYRWCDLLRVNRDMLGAKGMWSFYRWLHDSVAANRPWDRMVREMLTAQGACGSYGPANFYRIGSKPEEFAETVSQAFLGVRVQCAHCHNHPHEKWTQADYYRMANFFARIGRKGQDEEETIFAAAKGDIPFPRLGRPLAPAAFDGPALALDAPEDRRAFLARWMTAPENPYFARNIVNRVWKRYMGRGLVEPVDDLRLTNPASNEPLLEALVQDFVANGYDVKRLMRLILRSRAYQLSARANATNAADDRFYSRCLPRRLTAENLLDAICQVTGAPEKFEGMPMGTRAIGLPDTRIASAFLDAFGRPARQVTCECERSQEAGVAQALHLINGQTLNAKVAAKDGTLRRLLDSPRSDREILEELYMACLCRRPTPDETTIFLRTLDAAFKQAPVPIAGKMPDLTSASTSVKENAAVTQPAFTKTSGNEGKLPDTKAIRAQVCADFFWALLSGPEFQYNH